MLTLFSDLDHTLIYSHRVSLPGKKVLAERLNGKEQSYMSEYTFRYLQGERAPRLIPVTTRSDEQFRRLLPLIRSFGCQYALVCNGGLLLIDGKSDPDWLEETLALAEQELKALPEAAAWLRERCGGERTHTPQGLMAYAACAEPERLAEDLRRRVDPARLQVGYDGRKLYCIPKSINKGSAVRRFIERFSPDRPILAAGDSEFDLPMLEAADRGFAPAALAARAGRASIVGLDTETGVFSDQICDALREVGG